MNILDCFLGVFVGALACAYLLRVNVIKFGLQRLDYVTLHLALGIGCAVTSIRLLFGFVFQDYWMTSCVVVAALAHLSLTHRPGRIFRPPPYVNSDKARL